MVFFTVFVYFLVPETKQKTFEEIASQFMPGGDIEVEEIFDEVFGGAAAMTEGSGEPTETTKMMNNGASGAGGGGGGGDASPTDVRIRVGKEERAQLTKSEENICGLATG